MKHFVGLIFQITLLKSYVLKADENNKQRGAYLGKYGTNPVLKVY